MSTSRSQQIDASRSSAPEADLGEASPELRRLVAEELFRTPPDGALRMARAIRERHMDGMAAVLFYGSCLRGESVEGVLDFYALVDDYPRAYDSRTAAWLNANPWNYAAHTKSWRQWAEAACNALRASEARVVPVLSSADLPAETPVEQWEILPDKPGRGGGRAERRLFLRRGTEGETDGLHLPEALRRRGCAVTCYRFPEGINDLEMRPTHSISPSLTRR